MVYGVGILTMSHNGQVYLLSRLKDLQQGSILIHEHIASGRTHKQLDSCYLATIEITEKGVVVVGSTEEEAVVDMTATLSDSKLITESLQRSGLRNCVGHVKIGGDTSVCCRPTLAFDIGFVGESWFTEMHVGVDDTWKDITTRGIDDLPLITHLLFLITPLLLLTSHL